MSRVRNAFSEVFISDKPSEDLTKSSTRDVLEAVLTPYTNLNERDFIKVAQKAVVDLFDWAVQTNQKLNTRVRDILIGKDGGKSAAAELIEFAKRVKKDETHPLYNNVIINSLQMVPGSKVNTPENLQLIGKGNKVYDQNQIIYGFKELKQNMVGEDAALYRKLIGVAILQSGLSSSPISFTNLIPYSDFVQIYNETLSIINEMPNLANFYKLGVFQRNNWNNSDIVPYLKTKLVQSKKTKQYYNLQTDFVSKRLKAAMLEGKVPKVIHVSPYSKEGASDYIVYSWESGRISKKERAIRRKKSDYSHVNKALFKKVYGADGKPLMYTSESKGVTYTNYVYKAINAWGFSFKANELYDEIRPSVIDNGFMKVVDSVREEPLAGSVTITIKTSGEVEDGVIESVLEGDAPKAVATTAPTQQPITSVQGNVTFEEDSSSNYQDRTKKNASADATIALAYDFDSYGEKATRKFVEQQKKKYIGVVVPDKIFSTSDLSPAQVQVERIVNELNSVNAKTLNIAGNGLYTMRVSGYSQEDIDVMTYNLIKAVLESPNLKTKIESIVTGGQTGFDEAGAKAGMRLGIPTTIRAPKGWKFRNISGTDISNEQQFKARFNQSVQPTTADETTLRSQIAALEEKKKTTGITGSEAAQLKQLQTQLGKIIKSRC
jgi:hypothetical protein